MLKVAAIVVAVAIAAAGWLAQVAERSSEWFVIWNALAVLLVAVQGALGWRAVTSARQAREDFKVVVFDQVGPLAQRLALMSRGNAAERRLALGETLTVGVACAAGLATTTRVRATLFGRTVDDAGRDVFVPHTTLGRGDRPQSTFVRDPADAEGSAVWADAERDLPRFCTDVRAEPPPGWDPSKRRTYRTFITVPVHAGRDLVGLLTVNAPHPGDLTDDDAGTLQVIAALLGTALGMADAQWPVGGG